MLAACSTMTPEAPGLPLPTRPDEPSVSLPAEPPSAEPGAADSPARLPGWANEDHRTALFAYAQSCRASRTDAGRAVCSEAQGLAAQFADAAAARRFFETRFAVVEAHTADGSPGLLTSYFAPEYPARRTRTGEFSSPVLARPSDLTQIGTRDGRTLFGRNGGRAYPERAEIEAGGSPAEVLAWMRPEDLFFMQIQGSGYLTFEDGGHGRAAYAADNGHTFLAIARPMVERGILGRDQASGERIRSWLAANRGARADEIVNAVGGDDIARHNW